MVLKSDLRFQSEAIEALRADREGALGGAVRRREPVLDLPKKKRWILSVWLVYLKLQHHCCRSENFTKE